MEDKVSISLPELPKGKEFEDFIAAYFQSVGFFVEKNISDRATEEILELDISVTDYNLLPRPRLIEIKSGDWGFSDVFKVKGWMTYTRITKGIFIVQKGRDNFEYYKTKAKELNIDLIAVPDLKKTNQYLKKQLRNKTADLIDVETFRYSYWIDREYQRLITNKKKSNKNFKRFSALEKYYSIVNSSTFFTTNLLDKTRQLYDNYSKNPNITAKCANEIIGNEFNSDYSNIPYEQFVKTFYKCEFNDLQISTYYENQSRLRIIKCAVDFLLFKRARNSRASDIENLVGIKISKFSFLPYSFRMAIDDIGKHKYFNLYPVFWQWFMYAFGGFILLDFKDKEYELLSLKTGIPKNEIDNALKVLDILFPIKGSWFMTNKHSNILMLKFFSMPFRGIGANYRRMIYCKKSDGSEGEYIDLGITNSYTFNDLVLWNNSGLEVLYNSK